MAFPEEIAGDIRRHLEQFAPLGAHELVFVGPDGRPLHRANFHKSVWNDARNAVGLPNLHIHDLRHTGATLTATVGATLKELMTRLGHSSPQAAMMYQHATRERDQAIAKQLGILARDAQAELADREDVGSGQSITDRGKYGK